jgi:hypothetical protein
MLLMYDICLDACLAVPEKYRGAKSGGSGGVWGKNFLHTTVSPFSLPSLLKLALAVLHLSSCF